ncbi:MAG: hypothetical protein ABSG79_13590 [Bryobacteraceae bacterium]
MRQKAANGGAADVQSAADLGFADARAVPSPDFRSVYGRGGWPTQPFSVLPRLRQASPSSFPQNLSFELGEDSQQAGHRSPGWCGQVQRLAQRYETDPEMLQFL